MILTLVNDLLDLSKIEAFKFHLNNEYFDVVKVVGQVTDTLQPMVDIKKLVLVTTFKVVLRNENLSLHNFVEDDSSEKSDEGIEHDLTQEETERVFSKINGDQRRYTQILLNFVSNSIKFTPEEK